MSPEQEPRSLAVEPDRPAESGVRPACAPDEALACVLAVNRELNAAGDLETGLQRVAAIIRKHVPYQTFAVLLLDDLGRELRYVHAEGFPQ